MANGWFIESKRIFTPSNDKIFMAHKKKSNLPLKYKTKYFENTLAKLSDKINTKIEYRKVTFFLLLPETI